MDLFAYMLSGCKDLFCYSNLLKVLFSSYFEENSFHLVSCLFRLVEDSFLYWAAVTQIFLLLVGWEPKIFGILFFFIYLLHTCMKPIEGKNCCNKFSVSFACVKNFTRKTLNKNQTNQDLILVKTRLKYLFTFCLLD